MTLLIEWLKRIIQIGLWELIRSLGWRAITGVLIVIASLIAMIVILAIVLIGVLL